MSPLRYPYFGTVVVLEWLNYPDSYATVRLSHAGEVKSGDSTKSDTLVLQVGSWAWG
jgi:hypothetical protein